MSPAESVTVRVVVVGYIPVIAGVPAMFPFPVEPVEIDSPAGRPVAIQVNGNVPPIAVTVPIYGAPNVTLGRLVVVIVKGPLDAEGLTMTV